MRARLFFVWIGLVGISAAVGQQDFSGVEIKATQVSGPIHMLEGRGGNIGVSAGPDGILMVDDQYAPLAEKIRAALGKLGGDKPRFILNTHWHGDHTGGNPTFGRDGVIIAHQNVRNRLATRQELFGKPVEPLAKEGLPVVTYENSVSLHFNGEEIRVVHFPNGHTDGDGVVFFTKSNVVHMGDLMFAGMFPFIDLEHGGDVDGFARNVEAVLKTLSPDAKIIPGHGPLSTPEDLKSFHKMLVETTAVVKKKIAAGKSLEEIQKEGLPQTWAAWGNGFIKTPQWIETIHKSVKRP